MSLVTEEVRASATEYYRGNDVCMAQARRLLREVGLPNGLLPLKDVVECGYVESTGFVWLKQKKEIEHKFKGIDKWVRYGPEVTAFVEPCKIKQLTGVKAKEFLLWIVINEITIESAESKTIDFKNKATGISKTFPTSAFVVDEPEAAKVTVEEAEEKKEGNSTTAEAKEVADAVNSLDLKEKKGVEATAVVTGVEIKEV